VPTLKLDICGNGALAIPKFADVMESEFASDDYSLLDSECWQHPKSEFRDNNEPIETARETKKGKEE